VWGFVKAADGISNGWATDKQMNLFYIFLSGFIRCYSSPVTLSNLRAATVNAGREYSAEK